MNSKEPTTPLGDLASRDQPTVNRGPDTPPPSASGFGPGTLIAGRYRIVALLGRGGMGEVYRADDLRLGQAVALKFVDVGSDSRSLENLYHEVRVARQVSHPNVCRVHDVVEAEGLRFIAMEYVDGEDLASLLRRIGRLPAAGRFRDPMVAPEILIGIAGGIVSNQIFWGTAAVREWRGAARHYIRASTIDPLTVFIGDGFISHVQSIEMAIGTIFLSLLFRKPFGRAGSIAALVVLIASYALVAPAAALFILLLLYSILRSGLLTGVTIGATLGLLLQSPLTLDTGAWYWPRSVAVLLLLTLSAAWAARTAVTRYGR